MNTSKHEKIRKLQEKYISQLPAKLNNLNRTWLTALQNNDTSALTELRQMAHNLAGSAGTFGFPSVSVEARNLEEYLRSLKQEKNINSTIEDTISDLLQRIVSLVELGPDENRNPRIPTYTHTADANELNRLIYIIEDDELLAKEIATQLHYFDYEVETFINTSRAIEAFKLNRPSAMIIDINLPDGEMAGTEFALLLNEFSDTPVPSIFISARDDWQARLAAVRAHGNAYLTKPLDFNELLEHLDLVTIKNEPEPIKVLIVDDMEVLAEHYATVLAVAGMHVKTVSDIDDLLYVLSDFKPELILMDIYMPQCSGLEAAKIIRQKNELLSVPIVFLSTETDPLQYISAMELGGDDFLKKPITDDNLISAVQARAQRFRQLRVHMQHDGLTGLLNHVNVRAHLESEIARAQRHGEALSFAMLDIDNFKQVNDTYGHPVGDRVIKSVARMLIKRLRRSDLIGRYGGEEFSIILPDTDINTAHKVIEDIRRNFAQIVQQNNEVQFSCTLSAGITQLQRKDDINTLVNNADKALYEAKKSGRNKTCLN